MTTTPFREGDPSARGGCAARGPVGTVPRILGLASALALAGCAAKSLVTSHRLDLGGQESGVIYSLPKQYVLLKLVRAKADGELRDTFALEVQAAVPDPAFTFVAQLRHSRTRTDDWTIKTDANGLLLAYSGNSEDKTGEVMQQSLAALKAALGIVPAAQAQGVVHLENAPDKTFSYERVIDPLSDEDLKHVNEDLAALAKHYGLPDHYQVERSGDATNYSIPPPSAEGLYYRRPVQRTLTIYRHAPKQDRVLVRSLSALLPNGGPIGRLELPASRFVKTSYDVKFKDGMLMDHHPTQPSEALAVALLAPNIVREIVAIPTELIQVKINHNSKEEALVKSQKTLLDEQAKLIAALADAKKNAAPANPPSNTTR